jgi:membrane protein required for colicin V production
LSKIDLVIAIVLALGGFFGYRRGFLLELFFLCGLVLGVFIGFRLMGAGVEYLHKEFNADTTLLPYLSFLIIFILVVIFVSIFARQIKHSIDKTFLGKLDSLAGAGLGVVKYMFCASVVFWLISSFHYSLPIQWTRDSWLYPATAGFAPKVAGFVSGFLPVFREIFKQF